MHLFFQTSSQSVQTNEEAHASAKVHIYFVATSKTAASCSCTKGPKINLRGLKMIKGINTFLMYTLPFIPSDVNVCSGGFVSSYL